MIPIAAILKKNFYQFFVKLPRVTAQNFMSKAFSYQDLRRRGHYVSPLPSSGHDQTKLPRVI